MPDSELGHAVLEAVLFRGNVFDSRRCRSRMGGYRKGYVPDREQSRKGRKVSVCYNRLARQHGGRWKVPQFEEVVDEALSLEVDDRARLAERLFASLDDLSEEESERLWAEESERRLSEYRAGRAKAVSADRVHDRAEGPVPGLSQYC